MRPTFTLLLICFTNVFCGAQEIPKFTVTAYYMGSAEEIDHYAVEKLTHIVFSFCHLKGNSLSVDNTRDSLTIKKLVEMKKRNPSLKVLLSLGGWGGCKTCSEVFSTAAGRKTFAESTLALNEYFHTDGIDLDWEYPTIEGYPKHRYAPEDKKNFTELILQLRRTMGTAYEISFAAGGFKTFLDESVDWAKIVSVVDRVNLMTYDLINGNSKETGHHTALYSNPKQAESTDFCIQYLISKGIPRNKLVLGAAFYGRMWEKVSSTDNGLYQSGKFKSFIDYKKLDTFSPEKGFTIYWDDKTKAPYRYNASEKLFVTYEDKKSLQLKTRYALDQKLNGIMFWELTGDVYTDGLLDAIDDVVKTKSP